MRDAEDARALLDEFCAACPSAWHGVEGVGHKYAGIAFYLGGQTGEGSNVRLVARIEDCAGPSARRATVSLVDRSPARLPELVVEADGSDLWATFVWVLATWIGGTKVEPRSIDAKRDSARALIAMGHPGGLELQAAIEESLSAWHSPGLPAAHLR